jgi:hypothetical protein
MKGIILSEFVEYLEVTMGDDKAQEIINDSAVKSFGAYSRVGFYDYHELLQLLTHAVADTNTDADVLLDGFSHHLFSVFKRDYGVFFEGVSSAAEMLTQIDDHIHVEVQKLYPDAELPRFEHSRAGNLLTLNYRSPRPFAGVAQALVGACLKFFGGREKLISSTFASDQKSATFVIQVLDVDD